MSNLLSTTLVLLAIAFSPLYSQSNPVLNTATTLVKQHEGLVLKPYQDSTGISIGYGTNLSAGITQEEAEYLLTYRLAKLQSRLQKLLWYVQLTPVRKVAILDLAYNVGYSGLLNFTDLIWCLKHHYWNGAANRMKQSLWYKQTGTRAIYLVQLMRHG